MSTSPPGPGSLARARSVFPAAVVVGLVAALALGSTSIADWARAEPILDPSPRRISVSPQEEPAKVLNLRTESSPAKSDGAGVSADGDIASSTLSFVPVDPYRAVDSRLFNNGDMFPGVEVWFDVWTDTLGQERIPSDIKAVAYNLTVTGTVGSGGYLAVFPANLSWPGNSSINWFGPNLDLSNGGVVAVGNLTGPGQVSVYTGMVPRTATFFIMDITGYFV